MRTVLSILIIVALLAGAVGTVKFMGATRPVAEEVERPRLLPTVRVLPVERTDLQLELPSQGLIQAARSTTLAAEVAGRVVSISDRFKVGERFAEGEELLTIEDADYHAAVTQAESTLAEARAALASEEARAEQAVRDWRKLGNNREPSDLVLRKPQLASASARVNSSVSALEKARRDLERTRILAPFDGRLRQKMTEVGSYLAPGTAVAELSSVGTYEIRLPLPVTDLSFLPDDLGLDELKVQLTLHEGDREKQWNGRVVRTEGEVERSSRSIYLVAEVEESGAGDLLQPGLFLKARVQGRRFEDVYRVPRSAFLDGHRVLAVDGESRLRLREVKTLRADGKDMIVASGFEEGDRVCMTMLSAPVDGMEVNVRPAESEPTEKAQAATPTP